MNDGIDNILALRAAYRRKFLREDGSLDPDAELILADLMRFCRLFTSILVVSPETKMTDPYATIEAEGRREVLVRMLAHLHLDNSYLINLSQQRREANNARNNS